VFLIGYADYGEYWRDSYEDDNFVNNVDEMWKQVEPLYTELHTYVRRKLQKKYPNEMDKDSDTIPAHLLGNMWYLLIKFVWCLNFLISLNT
jgi:peptidyl-dipeptidase A